MTSEGLLMTCEICRGEIARVDLDKLRLPVMGYMFAPARVNFPPPFPKAVDWLSMFCPYCRKRPMIDPDRLTTTSGRVIVTAEGAQLLRKLTPAEQAMGEAEAALAAYEPELPPAVAATIPERNAPVTPERPAGKARPHKGSAATTRGR